MWLDVSGLNMPIRNPRPSLRPESANGAEAVRSTREQAQKQWVAQHGAQMSPLADRLLVRQRHLESGRVWQQLLAPSRPARHWTSQLLAQQTWGWLEEAFPGCSGDQQTRQAALQQALREFSPGTHEHSRRVGDLALQFADDLGLSEREQASLQKSAEFMEVGLLGLQIGAWSDAEKRQAAEEMRKTGKFHDIGKLAIPEHILHKAGPLDREERAIVEMHPLVGEAILSEIPGFQDILPAVRHHHERWDGKGYVDRLAGSQIPLHAQLISLSDTYDALTEDRPYRKAFSTQHACQEILRQRGGQFDGDLAETFVYTILSRQSQIAKH